MIKTEAQFFEVFTPMLEQSGLKVLSTKVKSVDDDFMAELPNLTIMVSLDGTDPQDVFLAMKKLESKFNKETKSEIRTGYYDAEIGYDEIPTGQAQIEIDCLPFFLDVKPSAPTMK